MKKILFISNITRKITSVASTSILATKEMGIGFLHAANWNTSECGQVQSDEKEYGIKIFNVSISRSPYSISNIRAYRQLCRIIRENKIDYIHCNTPVGGLLGRMAGKKCHVKKVIYQAHGFHFYKGAPKKNWIVYHTIEKLMARYTDAIITMNKEDYEAASTFKLRKGGKIYNVHGVGIDLSLYDDLEKYREKKRTELGYVADDIILISMGDLIPRKNYQVAIEAISKCSNSKLHYLICGNGPELDNLKSYAAQKGVSNQVHFLGFRSDIKELLAASDIFIFTSLQEGLPRSMMEAMAAGLPCVASKIRGNVDLIEDGKGGFLCDPHDSDSFARAIELCDTDTRNRFKQDNLIAIKRYDIHVVEEEIKKIYEEVFK